MGYGVWTTADYVNYNTSTKASSLLTDDGFIAYDTNVHQIYTQKRIDEKMNPKNAVRECRDTEEHPNTLPVILALDVTGSMGNTASRCAQKLNDICTEIFDKHKDVEIMIMAIGDFAYDRAPLQVGQFESDVRIAEWLDKIYFEAGGGGNHYESYSAAWMFGLNNCDLDCWKRGQKGIIITLGDEPLNPVIDNKEWIYKVGGEYAANIETEDLYKQAVNKFDIYHIAVKERDNCFSRYAARITDSFGKLLGDHLIVSSLDGLPSTISKIVTGEREVSTTTINEITW